MIRPKWTELYAARRRRRCAASTLPELPDSFFGWIPVLYRITDEEVLESAGLDAYVVGSCYLVHVDLVCDDAFVEMVLTGCLVPVLLQVRHQVPDGYLPIRRYHYPPDPLQVYWQIWTPRLG